MIRNIKETFLPKTGLREKQLLQDPGYVEDVEDTLLHAAWSVQVIRIILWIRSIIFQQNFSNAEDCKTDDNKLHCIILSLFYLMLKTSEMHTNVYELQCSF